MAFSLDALSKQVRASLLENIHDLPGDEGERVEWFVDLVARATDAVRAPDAGQAAGAEKTAEVEQATPADQGDQRRLLDEIISASPGGMAVISGSQLIFQLANDAFRDITPHPEVDPVGRGLDEIWPAMQGGFDAQMIRPVLEDEASLTVDCMIDWESNIRPRTLTLHARPVEWMGERAALLVVWETTELEQALEESRRRAEEADEGRRILDALLAYIPEGITVASAPDLRVIYESKFKPGLVERHLNAEKTARSSEAPRNKSVDLPIVRATIGEVIENEEVTLRRNGQTMHLLVNAGPIRDKEGNITGAVSTVRDITERKRVEMHQQFLSELGRSLVALRSPEDLMEGVAFRLGRYLGADRCFISMENNEKRVSRIYEDYHRGLSSLVGAVPHDRYPPGMLDRLRHGKIVVVADLTRDLLTSAMSDEIFAVQKVMALAAVPWQDREGAWAGTLVAAACKPRVWRQDEVDLLRSVADLTRLALENAVMFDDLREFRHRFEVALRNAPIAVFSTDRHLHCTWIFNPNNFLNIEKMLGHKLDLLPSMHGAEVVGLIEILRQVIDSGEGAQHEIHLPVNGETKFFDLTVEPLRDEDGQVIGLTCAAMEITHQRKMEAEALLNLAHIEIQHRLIREREQERMRIARDLHDGPLQDLIASNFTLVEAMEIQEKEPRLVKMHELQRSIYRQIQELRGFCNGLRPPVLGPFGLGKTIRSHLETVQERYPELVIHHELDSDQRVLPEELRMVLFRAYQELINNVVRHARARQVTVNFHLEPEQAVLEVEDDGVGFQAPESWIDMARNGHLGLVGLRERVETAGGKVIFELPPGGGTRVRITVPRTAAAQA